MGGRTNHWGRIALRFSPIDFKSYTRDGLGTDWPIGYEDIAPYYDKVECYIGVFGTKENVSSAPDGIFLPPPKPRCTELIVKKACDNLNIICIPSRLAILTRAVNGRVPCHYCGQCGRGCITGSNFSSSQVLIPPAMADRQADVDYRRDGARGSGRQGRKSAGGFLHRQSYAHGKKNQRARGGAGGQFVRIRAAAAQLQVSGVFRRAWRIRQGRWDDT